MTHAAMDAEARRVAGISDALLRISVGIEAAEDLRADIAAGLERVNSLTASAPAAELARAAC
jgi:cystathionine gamma-synthase